MTAVDLDAWQRAADHVRNCDVPEMRVVTADPEEIDALLAELRAAREFRPLVEWMARQPCECEQPALPVTGGPPCQFCDARTALAAYDKVTGEVPR